MPAGGPLRSALAQFSRTLVSYRSRYDVAVAADAVGSRLPERRRLGLERMRAHGVDIVDSEMVVFEWLRGCEHPRFKAVLPVLKGG